MSENEEEKEKVSFFRVLGLLSTLGITVAVSVVGGVLGGVWLDSKFRTKPVLMLAGLAVGLVAGCWACYKMIMRSLR
ncbi:MAG: AtpZ/AtpI family protein [Planctomycetota bacterium]|nr:AtpZ/AtpI family protein [Planctomycetota bacterium]